MAHVFITGSSVGFGRLTTDTLLRAGHTVFATMRDPGGRNAAHADAIRAVADEAAGAVHVIDLDVTDDAAVDRAVGQALELGGHIDVVVNNAGAGTGGWTETFTPQQVRDLFELNVVSVQRVNRAVLPHMRERKDGLLVHVSSTLGRMVFPYCGVYTASKYALEALAETYRYELAATGVDAVIVEPGGFATNFFANIRPGEDAARAAGYGPLAEAPLQFWQGVGEMISGEDAPDPQLVADAISRLVTQAKGQRPLRTVVAPGFDEGPGAINQTTDGVQRGLFDAMQLGHLLGPSEG